MMRIIGIIVLVCSAVFLGVVWSLGTTSSAGENAASSPEKSGKYSGGSGLSGDPYLIEKTADLVALSIADSDWDSHFRLTGNVDMAGVDGFSPIAPDMSTSNGFQGPPFTGVLDGAGYAISNLVINLPDQDSVGLFGCVAGGEIRGVVLKDVNVTGHDNVGGLVGRVRDGSIISCQVNGRVSARKATGGLVGSSTSGKITSCHTAGIVTGRGNMTGGLAGGIWRSEVTSSHSTATVTGHFAVGGLVGYYEEEGPTTRGSIVLSHAAGDVAGLKGVGGLVGGGNGDIVFSYANGTVNGQSFVGGLVGDCHAESRTFSSFSTGAVSGESYVGGLVGESVFSAISSCYATGAVKGDDFVGGLVGNNGRGNVGWCYAIGAVSGKTHVGGLVGNDHKGLVKFSFWNADTTNQKTSAAGEVASTAEMQTPSYFADASWDLEEVWGMTEANYPKLRWQLHRPDRVSAQDLRRFELSGGYSGGKGTPDAPYLIGTSADLVRLSLLSADWDSHFRLANNIDMAGVTGFTPIAPDTSSGEGYQGTTFTGVCDGDGHVISNLKIELPRRDSIGLFGRVDEGLIRNLGLESVTVAGRNDVGGLAGYIGSGRIISSYATGSVSGDRAIGGLIGINEKGHIESCYATASVDGQVFAGGLVGRAMGGRVESSYAAGSVYCGEHLAGGFVGSGGGMMISSCFWDVYASSRQITRIGIVEVLSDTGAVQETIWPGRGLPTGKMQTKATFAGAGWDFDKVWIMPDSGYPQLRIFANRRHPGHGHMPATKKYSGGTGKLDDPYMIGTPADLVTLGKTPSDWRSHFRMTQSIDMANVRNFTPIALDLDASGNWGFEGVMFTGVFDGDGHIIKNLHINLPEGTCIGLFGGIGEGGTVRNLGLEEINIVGHECVGGLVGYCEGGRVATCFATGSVKGWGPVGGLVGYGGKSTMDGSYFTGMVQGTMMTGGLVGTQNEGAVLSSFTKGKVRGSEGVGGLVGGNGGGRIERSFSSCGVSGSTSTGGLVGELVADSHILYCYFAGLVKARQSVGGLVGKSEGEASIRASFWDVDSSGQKTSAEGVGLTTVEMQKKATFEAVGWDFPNIWNMPTRGYPELKWYVEAEQRGPKEGSPER